MYTRCPHCETYFRVTSAQLHASGGQVCCGHCETVFDAFSSLSSRPPEIGAAQPPIQALEAVLERASPLQPQPQSPVSHEPAVSVDALGPSETASPPESPALALPLDLFAKARPGPRWPWLAANAAALILLAIQGAWFQATAIALQAPEVRPVLEAFCGLARCRVGYARQPEALAIEASDLQLVDPARPGQILLTAAIRNRSSLPQELPALEVTLSGEAGQAPARRVLRPEDYLDQKTAAHRGDPLNPNQELAVRLYLDSGELHPTSYRLYLFFG